MAGESLNSTGKVVSEKDGGGSFPAAILDFPLALHKTIMATG